jgi:thiol-disulfide isomerase/thioredoxin
MKHPIFQRVLWILVFSAGPAMAVPMLNSMVPTSEDLSQYKTADALWNRMMEESGHVKAAEMRYDHESTQKWIPLVRASVREFIRRYPTYRETAFENIWVARLQLCDMDEIGANLGVPGAPSQQNVIAEFEQMAGNPDAPKKLRGIAAAKAIGAILDQTQGADVPPEIWKNIDAKITDFTQEFGSDFSYTNHHPAIELRNLYNYKSKPFNLKFTSVDGSPTDVSSMRGKVVLIDFWATWCGPCRGEVPNVVAAYNKYHNRGFEIVGVSLDQDKDALLAFTKENGMVWPQYFDGKGWKNDVSSSFDIHSIPAMWLVDKNGMLLSTEGCDDLSGRVEKALEAK